MGTSVTTLCWDFKVDTNKNKIRNKTMFSLRMLMLMSLVTYATSLSCWHSAPDKNAPAQYTSMRATHIPVVMKDCASPDNTSCMKEWYTVRSKVSDVFYKLGCSSKAVAAEVKTAKGTGEHWVCYCKGDSCNSSTMFQ